MALYETVFIARQDISASQVEALAETFAALIAEGKGEVKKREYWGLRTLAFRIKKNRKGHYVLFNIDAPSPAVAEMERNMRDEGGRDRDEPREAPAAVEVAAAEGVGA